MENTTTVLPNATNGGFYATTGGYKDFGCLDELIQSNNIHNNATSILNAIHTSTASVVAATQAQSLAGIEATNRNGNANILSTERNGGEGRLVTERTAGETRLNIQTTAAEIREVIRDEGRNNYNAIRDVKDEVFRESCKTREELLKGFAQVNLEACKNTDAIRNDLKSCCCEIRADIAKLGSDSIAAQLADAKLQNALLNLKIKV